MEEVIYLSDFHADKGNYEHKLISPPPPAIASINAAKKQAIPKNINEESPISPIILNILFLQKFYLF